MQTKVFLDVICVFQIDKTFNIDKYIYMHYENSVLAPKIVLKNVIKASYKTIVQMLNEYE